MNEAFPYATGFVKVVNRTALDLSVTYNGRACAIPAHGFVYMSKAAAEKAVFQNRIMGTEDPYSPSRFQSKVFVEGWKMDEAPIDKLPDAVEALDRSLLPADRQNPKLIQHGTVRRTDVEPFRANDAAHTFVGSEGDV